MTWGKYNARIRRCGALPLRGEDGIELSWNSELQRPLIKPMERGWKAFQDASEEIIHQSGIDICQQLDVVRENVQSKATYFDGSSD